MREILIKIPDEDYIKISNSNPSYADDFNLYYAIKNGKTLQKGHGDLVDRNEVIKSLFNYHNGKKTIGQCIDDVQTIISADKE